MKMKTTLSMLASLCALFSSARAEPLSVGSLAPAVNGVDQDGKTVTFKTSYDRGVTLVYFYPKSDTPGCTKQACSLRDDWSALQKKGIEVLGVSEDTVEAQQQFKEKYHLPFTLIADHDGKVAAAFGVPTMLGFAKRQSFLIKDGKVVWNMLNATTATHSKDVLAAYEALEKK